MCKGPCVCQEALPLASLLDTGLVRTGVHRASERMLSAPKGLLLPAARSTSSYVFKGFLVAMAEFVFLWLQKQKTLVSWVNCIKY